MRLLVALLATLLVALLPASAGQPLVASDRTRIEQYGARYIAALNHADAAERASVIGQIFSGVTLAQVGAERVLAQMERLRTEVGPQTFHHAELAEVPMGDGVSRVLHVFARSDGTGRWRDFQFRLDPQPPHALRQLAFVADVSEPVYLPNSAIADPSTLAWLNAYVDRLVRDEGLSGSLLVAVGDRPVLHRHFGNVDAAGTRPVTAETRFNLGSGNKMFTALAIAQLVEAGRLRYTDPIAPFFPDLPDQAAARRITVGHLLSHTSGLGELWTDDYERHWKEIRTLEDLLPWVYKAGVTFPAGARRAYSNSNFVLAGLIVQRVSGTDYFDHVAQRIYRPAGMTSTDSYEHGSRPSLAVPLRRDGSGWAVAAQGVRGSPAGGGYSTAADMLRFGRALKAGRLVSPATVALMTSSKPAAEPSGLDYGYGFILERGGGVASYGHGGIARGVNFEFRYFPGPDITLVAFSNQDNGAYDDLRKNVTRLITGER